ncbi:MAG: efflux transporter outer membrane subunit [Pseudomonadota bacterium]
MTGALKQGLWFAAAFAMTGCAAGPNYEQPEYAPDAEWVGSESKDQAGEVPLQWWAMLNDEGLNEYLALAAAGNLDIKAATARVDEARALRGISRSVFWPQVGLNASYTSVEQSIESPGPVGSLIEAGLVDRELDFYNASLDASWEIDIFGGNRRLAEAADASLEASLAAREATILQALAETASAYFELRGAQQRLTIARSNIDSQQRTLEVTRRKVQAGLARRIDQLRAEAQLDAFRALLPALEASVKASSYRLAVLTGRAPSDATASAEAGSAAVLPEAPAAVPVGMPADVLRRRPDVRIAERELAAATAQIGVAKADFFPRLVLGASYGFETDDFSSIGSSRARTTALVPFVSWPVFQGGRLRANLEGADARAIGAVALYEKSVLSALADAESAIAAYVQEARTLEHLAAAADASREAAQLAQKLYEKGLADFLTVLDAQRRLDETDDARAQSHTRLLLNLVRVYKALGGGWQV